jgi:hypothetical protein
MHKLSGTEEKAPQFHLVWDTVMPIRSGGSENCCVELQFGFVRLGIVIGTLAEGFRACWRFDALNIHQHPTNIT